MFDYYDFPNAIEMEKQLLSAMLLDDESIVSKVLAIINVDDFYRTEHKLVFKAMVSLYSAGAPISFLSVEEELRKNDDLKKIDSTYLFSIINTTYTTARAEYHAKVIKEKATLRRLILASKTIRENANLAQLSSADIIAKAQLSLEQISCDVAPVKKTSFKDFFASQFQTEVDEMKNYADRRSGFDNLDRLQLFSPGLYVIGATPAAGKTTFCWQLLEQLARQGETCIFCSYEMSKLELFSKSVARELFRRVPSTNLTAADIRRGAWSVQLENIVHDFTAGELDLSVLELQDESVDDLLALLKPFCSNRKKAPIICLDYLQIVPNDKENIKLGIDDSVRKLKKFQRDTNTTFFVISSFNRQNYTQSVSFESFKESGNIEYTADVVWSLQLNVLNHLRSGNLSDTRKQIDEAKKKQPRQIQLKCLKNRQGINYECFFEYFAAHDCFVACESFDSKNDLAKNNNPQRRI